MQNRNTLYIVIAILIVLAVGLYIFHEKQPTVPTSGVSTTTPITTGNASTTIVTATSSTGSSISASGPDGSGYTMSIIPLADRPATPDYQRSLTFDASVNAAARAAMTTQLANLVAEIKKDPTDFNAWVSLGNLRLIGGDTAGAKEIWDYASTVWPTNQVTFNNLGDYYTNYVKDYAKAEANYLIAIKNKPSDPAAYRNLFNLYYTVGYKREGTTAEDILKKGIAASPTTTDLQVLLARYYRDTNRVSDAKAEYKVAIATAQSQGQTSTVTSLQTESASF